MQTIKYIVNEVNQPSATGIKDFNNAAYILIEKELRDKELMSVIVIQENRSPIIETYIIKN